MLLVSQQRVGSGESGIVSRAVGGSAAAAVATGTASSPSRRPTRSPKLARSSSNHSAAREGQVGLAWGNDAPPPVELEAGDEAVESLKLQAGHRSVKRFPLGPTDRITWDCTVASGHTIDFCAKVSVHGGRSAVRCEGKRVQLVGVDSSRMVSERERANEFHGVLDLNGEHAGCVPCIKPSGEMEGNAVLVLEMDNSFSYFTSKDVTLRVSKKGSSRVNGGHDAQAQAAEESLGAFALTDDGPEEEDEEEARIRRLRALITEALRLCPAGTGLPASLGAVREHLRAANTALGRHAVKQEEDELGPLG